MACFLNILRQENQKLYLLNKILSDKKIPSVFKTGLITPVLKKGKDPKLLEHYRGITVTSIFGKLFEYALLYTIRHAVRIHRRTFSNDGKSTRQ